MKLAILGPSESKIGYTTKRLLEEAKKEFKEVKLIPLLDVILNIDKKLDVVYDKKSLSGFDYILPRIDSKRALIGYPIIRFLDYMKILKPYLSETILIAHNKFLTLHELMLNDIPVPKTYLTSSKKSAKSVLDKQKMPIMLKLLSGFGGQGVMFMESKESVLTAIETMRKLNQDICLEEYIENPGEDVRGIVAGDEIIASFKRIAAKGEKRANIYSGGKSQAFKLSEEFQDIVLRSAESIGSKICAIDVIQGKKSSYVLEVNINPGIQSIEKATDINVAHRIINFVKSEVKK